MTRGSWASNPVVTIILPSGNPEEGESNWWIPQKTSISSMIPVFSVKQALVGSIW
jgi:hypothetical protein